MNIGDNITFDAKKNFVFLKPLGSGGTGDTLLFEDKTTNMLFAFKKYVPKDAQYIDEHYKRFVDEIKILFRISHPNIVRIYNYYLYPQAKTGYLQMEYIDGRCIEDYFPEPWEKNWNEIFTEAISAFEYLEQNQILHRDIRPANILIDKQENVKIIDFGFGKQLSGSPTEANSILLNWPATEMPDEVQLNQEYDHRTEIYFVGTLFKKLVKQTNDYNDEFNYQHIIDKMIKINPTQRYQSFSEIVSEISQGVLSEIDFSLSDKETYQIFASDLSGHINHYIDNYNPINQISITLTRLAELIRTSSLEDYIQANNQLIKCFVNGGFSFKPTKNIKVQTVVDFYGLVTSLPPSKQKILFDNIYNRLSLIPVNIEDDDVPF